MFIKKYFDKEKVKDNPYLLINFIFSFFPISFILGSLFVNLNLVLFCCLGIYYLRGKIFNSELNFSIKIIFLFFIVIFFSTSLSFIKSLYLEGYDDVHLIRLIKSILLLRFFLLLLIIYLLNKYDVLNFKYFFLSTVFSSIVLSLDVIYQYIFGFNIIGLESHDMHNSGFFGNELTAGIFLQRFSLFSILFLAFKLKNKNSQRYILTTITICILGVGILFSGNRMPLIIFMFGLFLIFLFDIKLKKIITLSTASLFVLFALIMSSDEKMKTNYLSYYTGAKNILTNITPSIFKKKLEKNLTMKDRSEKGRYWKTTEKGTTLIKVYYDPNFQTVQERLFLSAIDTWKMNKIFGNGMKSFRLDCKKLATTPPTLTEDEKKKVIELYEVGKTAEADDLIEKVLERQVGVPGVTETIMAQNFISFKKNRLCSSHPHNYYLEILTEAGIIGLLVTLIIASLFGAFIIKNFKFFRGNNLGEAILLAAVISIILEMFPLRTTGSLFNTNNATYLILISSIVLCHKTLLKIDNLK